MSVVEAKPAEPDSDDEWVIDSEPLVNLLTFGWMEGSSFFIRVMSN